MATNSDKNWNRPWSMEEIIENSENWSLAGDVALLNSIKAFADNMLTKTVAISDNVDDLLNNLNEVSLKLDISQNEFQSLRNTQFIESRVYEDDETLDSRQEVKIEEKEPSEEEKEKMIKESIVQGLAVVDKYFDRIEVSISDSEDESEKSYVLQAKDLYANRPLPLIIGTEEWYKKWHVGLAESSSESETDNVSETYSDSDSGDDLPKDMFRGSETSSELDFSSQASKNRPVANSTFNDSVKKPDIFASDEESDEQGSLPVKTPISNKNFAEELAAKLGNVISEREDIPEEINRKPIQPAQTNKFVGDLFSDEPPPLDELEDTILPKSAQSGLFSGGQGLFDDNEDELFWGQQDKGPNTKPKEDKLFQVEPEKVPTVQATVKNVTLLPKSSQVSKGLFDSDDSSSDDDIFAANKKQLTKQPFLQPYKTTAPLFDEEPPALDTQKKTTEEVTKKKPVGGVSIFGTSDLFGDQKIGNILKNQQKEVADNKNIAANRKEPSKAPTMTEKKDPPKTPSLFADELDNKMVPPLAKPDLTAKSKKISLFDDDDDLFRDDLFSNITSKKLTSNLFDDQDQKDSLFETNVKNNNMPKSDIFGDLDNVKRSTGTIPNKNKTEEKSGEQNVPKPKKNISLFSDNEEEEGIFGGKPNVSTDKENRTDVANNNAINIQSEKENDVKTEESLEKIGSETNEILPQREIIGAEKKVLKGLFDNEDENEAVDLFKDIASKTQEKEDLFGNNFLTESGQDVTTSPPREEAKPVTEPPILQVTSPTPKASNDSMKTKERSAISLFGSSPPPPDDDDWDTKSDNFSDNEEQFSYRIGNHSEGLSLFDNEPPSLGRNESSGIVGDYNTRVDTDDSSFYPHASSSRRLSSDIYNEQQSQDSFFVTKNKTESITDIPQLGIIPEDTRSSILSITPSGKLEDLEESKGQDSTTDNGSVFNQNPPDKPKKPVSLFDDDYKSKLDSDDLFAFTSQAGSLPKLSKKRLSLFDNLDNILDEKSTKPEVPPLDKDNPRKNETDVTIPEVKNTVGGVESPKQTDSDVQNKITTIAGQLKNEFDKEAPQKIPSGSPRKLKHNLNINVNALMPGYAPPKLRDMSKSHSLDLPKEHEATPTNLSTPDVSFATPDLQGRFKNATGLSSEKAVSFGDTLDNVEILHSVTKDRARIPIKRRPSTRRGRQQAISKSEADVSLEKEGGDVNRTQLKTADVESKVEECERVMETEPVTKDLPETIIKETPPVFEPPNMGPKESEANDLFDDDVKEDTLFPGLAAKSANVGDKSKSSIFDSADSDSELFGPSKVKKPKTESTSKAKSDNAPKKSLFNDSSSDDDLFSTSSSGRRKEHFAKIVEKKTQKTSTLRKLENIEADDDPLSSLLK